MPKRKAAPSERSKLANYLVGQVCWGLMSAGQAQTIAQLAVEDAEDAPNELHRLARLGSFGQCPQNVWRDLKRSMIAVHLPEPHDVLKENEVYKLLYPHEVLASLYENYRDMFNAMFDVTEAARFWDDVKETKLFREHPLCGRSDKARALPIGLHGDGAPVSAKGKTWQKSADFLSFSSLIGSGPHRLLHIIISAVWTLGLFRGVWSSFVLGGGRTDTQMHTWLPAGCSFWAKAWMKNGG